MIQATRSIALAIAGELGVPSVELCEEPLCVDNILCQFPGSIWVSGPANQIVNTSEPIATGAQDGFNLVLFGSLNNDGLGARKLGLRQEWVCSGGLEDLNGEHWMDLHGRGQLELNSFSYDALEDFE